MELAVEDDRQRLRAKGMCDAGSTGCESIARVAALT